MRKVYCNNCKWAQWFDADYCRPPINIKETLGFWDWFDSPGSHKKRSKTLALAYRVNAHNDCPHYYRKWWKFWVIK